MKESDYELLTRVKLLLDNLSFPPDAPRSEKWRTTDQLANELDLTEVGAISRLNQILLDHEAQGPKVWKLVRRAKYPDRTTVLPLWGSTKRHGQPWPGLRPDRSDPAEDLPPKLVVPPGAPHVFLSHTHDDAPIALRLAEEMANISIGTWMFETQIAEGGNIADCVRKALGETDALVAFVSRSSIASLWVLTELHTSLQVQRNVILIVDADDPLLLQLLQSAHFPNPDMMFDLSVAYDKDVVKLLKKDYERRQTPSRTDRYESQVHDFLATLPLYLGTVMSDNRRVWRSLLAFPQAPPRWSGFLKLDSLLDLPMRLDKTLTNSC